RRDGPAFLDAAVTVGAGGRVIADPVGRDAMQRGIGLAVPTTGEPVRVGAPGGDRDRGGAAQAAKEAEERSRSGWSPAVRSSWAPTAGPTPLIAISAGLAAAARASMRVSRSAISTPRARCLRARARSA